MTGDMTSFEAFELELWGLRTARERERLVPVLLNFAVRQRDHSLEDAVEATLQIYRRYRPRYQRDATQTSKTSLLVPEIEAFSNGLHTDDRDARVILPGRTGGPDATETFVLDSDLYYVDEAGVGHFPAREKLSGADHPGTGPVAVPDADPGTAPGTAPDTAPGTALATAARRVATIGMSLGTFGPGRVADRSGAFTLQVRGGTPGLFPTTPVTGDNAWYAVRLHEGLTGEERLAVLAEILGYIFLGHAPQVWRGDRAWTNLDGLVPEAPATAHWWIAPESRAESPTGSRAGARRDSRTGARTGMPGLTVSSRSFTDLQAREAMLAGTVGMARAGLLPHLPSGRRLGAPGAVPKELRWVPVLTAAQRIEELLDGSMRPPQAAPPVDRHSRGYEEP
jgi:hypothetical protein